MAARRFFVMLCCLAAVGLALRLAYVFGAGRHVAIVSTDGEWFHLGANDLADGKGFLNPLAYFLSGVTQPGATHPPAWTTVLAAGSIVGLRTFRAHAVLACFVGTATIPLVGLAGRRLAGPWAGLVAALFATFYPNFWMYEAQVLSETLVIFGAALAILLALRFLAEPSLRRAVAVGAVCGFMALVRAEQILLFVFLLIPVVLLARDNSFRRRLGWLVASFTAGMLIVAPWVGFNLTRFQERTYLTSDFGSVFLPANCDLAYHGPYIGSWVPGCAGPAAAELRLRFDPTFYAQLEARHMDDSTFNAEEAKLGVRYVKGHLADLPTVVLAREGRVWGVFRPFQQLHTDLFKGDINVLRAGLIAYWLLAAFAVGGVIVLRRRLPELVVLGSFIASLIVTTAVTYGTTRFRAPADVAIVLLAAVAVDTLIRRASRSKARTGDTIRQPVRRAGRRSSDRPTGAVQS